MGHDQAVRDASGFRQRGHQVTRTETFVDAAFAFSLTLLVIFHDDLPQTAAELRGALLRVPTFVLCFAMLALFWAAHNRWSRRFGLDDPRSVVLSLAFVLVVLVYVYPLRMVISSFLALVSAGALPSELGFDPARRGLDLQTTFMVYSVGFLLLSLIVIISVQGYINGAYPVMPVLDAAGNAVMLADGSPSMMKAFNAWGWRIPFLGSIVLLLISLYIRLQMNESPAFKKMKEEGAASKAPLREAFGNWKNGKIAIIALLGLTAGQAVV